MEHINLLGSEDVYRAGTMMQQAATEMTRAASSIEESLQMHQRFLDDWLSRFEDILKENMKEED